MAQNSSIDRISFALLRLLSNDGRLSNKELAASVGLAPSSAHERLKQLRAAGTYKGTHAEIDLKALGFGLEALIHIGLARHRRKAVDALTTKMASVPEIRQVFLVTGHFDLIVHVAIRDMEHLKDLAYDLTLHPIVDRLETSVIFEAWQHHHLPEPPAPGTATATRKRRRR